MKRMQFCSFFLFYFLYIQSQQDHVIMATAALIPQRFEERKQEYIVCLETLGQQTIPVYIVESCIASGPTFLDHYCTNVFYSNTNITYLRNKGVNEAIAMLAALEHFDFDDDIMIIKITGRYTFDHFSFLNLVQAHPQCDAFVKYDALGQVITGCFAMRSKHLKRLLQKINYKKMEQQMISIEYLVAKYIKKHIDPERIYTVDSLGISGKVFGDGITVVAFEI